jgi:monosaccharide-transporting ATPase
VLRAEGLTGRHQLRRRVGVVRPGEVVGLGGLLGSGRSETAKAIAGALPLDSGRSRSAASPRAGSPASRIRAGSACCPRTARPRASSPVCRYGRTSRWPRCPALPVRPGLDARVDRIVDTFMKRLRIKASGPHQKVASCPAATSRRCCWPAARLHPKVLLLDEPTRGIDVGAKAEVQALIDELAEKGSPCC